MEKLFAYAYPLSLLLVLAVLINYWRKLTRQFTLIITRELSDNEVEAINRFIHEGHRHAKTKN